MNVEPIFFSSQDEFRLWLQKHHAGASEVVVGFYKKTARKPTLTWPESVDQALCFGWIDGVRRAFDSDGFTIRFTPRTPKSSWSRINVAKVEALLARGLMQPSGLEVYERRGSREGHAVSDEAHLQRLGPSEVKQFRINKAAWSWYEQQPSGYRRTAARWVNSAKRPETRQRRLAALIADSATGRKIKPMRNPGE